MAARLERRQRRGGCRALALLLAAVFATGYVPTRAAPCSCTEDRNCGCRCWDRQRAPSADHGNASAPAAKSCCAGKTRAGVTSCAAGPHSDSAPAPDADSAKPHVYRALDWTLVEPPASEASHRLGEVIPQVASRARFWSDRPATPPP